MKSIIKFLRPFIVFSFRLGWYITRPKTRGAKVVIVHGNHILLIKTTYGYNYSLPGGGVKTEETPEQAAKREAFEEIGIALESLIPLPSFVTYEEFKQDTVYGFYSEVPSKDFKLDRLEIDLAEWHPIDNLPKLGPVTEKIVTMYRNKRYIS